MRWLTIGILSAVTLVYLLVGAAIFMALEQDNESSVSSSQFTVFQNFLTDNTCVTQAELESFVSSVITAYDAGVVATADTSSESNWDYGSSIFFSLTVITSIGYGHVSPETSGGRVFLIFYAIFGIPLMALLLVGIGDKMKYPVNKLEEKICLPDHAKKEKIVKRILILIAGFIIFSFVPAGIFTAIENWTYLESWYFTVVTLTTVGFGDYVPGQDKSDYRVLYKLVVAVWIVTGLAFLSLVMNVVGDMMKAQSKKVDDEMPKEEEEGTSNSENGKDGDKVV